MKLSYLLTHRFVCLAITSALFVPLHSSIAKPDADEPAGETPVRLRGKYFPTLSPPGLTIELTPIPGFHLNWGAPARFLLRGVPDLTVAILTKTKTHALVRLSHTNTPKPGPEAIQGFLYICDDANTICEKESLSQIQWRAAKGPLTPKTGSSGKSNASQTPGAKDMKFHSRAEAESILAGLETASKPSPLLITFSARWCPACRQLDETIQSTPLLQKMTANQQWIKLDQDDPDLDDWKKLWGISSIPNTILISKGRQIERRLLGTLPKKALTQWAQASFVQLDADPLTPHQLALHAIERSYQSGQWIEALALLEKWKPSTAEETSLQSFYLAECRIQTAASEAVKTAERDRLLSETNVRGYYQIMEMAPEHPKTESEIKLTRRLLTFLAAARTLPEPLTGTDVMHADVAVSQGELTRALGEEAQSQIFYREAIALLKKLPNRSHGVGFGERLLESAVLADGLKDFVNARAVLEPLLKQNPDDHIGYYARARVELAAQKCDDALRFAKLSLDRSYGYNRLRSYDLSLRIFDRCPGLTAEEGITSSTRRAQLLAQAQKELKHAPPSMKESRLGKKILNLAR